ncbi:GNAT family acetyltransferase Nat4 [Aspergillus campestris IBT 28561]|uniref:N-alpha-acetyltransferase 40 n=1 Tax=Aspergillus campestris (strain IBT 28561) TaxID=1392248 RepID=A0A2I1CWS9_ASPC2|nr:GNAT family acetyltransferase Nat4 [Aspergillus campestris IBT 28561]PKY02079.1 GNAT family acetyltransferase Nat4 [Aspergillus campestris IBT 28561]
MPTPVKGARVTKARRTSAKKQTINDSKTTTTTKEPKPFPLVERTNQLPIDEFISRYVPLEGLNFESPPRTTNDTAGGADDESEKSRQAYTAELYTADNIPAEELEACFQLIEHTSAEAYQNSSIGWAPVAKKKEMRLPDMRYIVVRGRESPSTARDDADGGKAKDPFVGFLSFMVTYEDGKEVIYCYEVHIKPEAQRQGLGRWLLLAFEDVGRRVGLEQAMLTCFCSNEAAVRCYNALGYVVDESSPRPRRLRSGVVHEPDYMILSKRL